MKPLPLHLSKLAARIAAVLFIGASVCFLFAQEPPVGVVQGRVVMAESGAPLAGADVYLSQFDTIGQGSSGPVRVPRQGNRRVKTNKDGTFVINRVPAGGYLISAVSHAHHSDANTQKYVDVYEGSVTPMEVSVLRSEPLFQLHQGQVIFGSNEPARLGFTGYRDLSKPRNADAMHIKVWKTRLSSVLTSADGEEMLQTVGRGYNHKETIPAALIKGKGANAPQQLIDSEIPISGADDEGFYHTRYKFNTLSTGLYLVEASHGKLTDATWMLVTDTALVIKHSREQLVAYAVDMQTGSPLPGSEVRAYSGGAVVARAKTDANGLANLQLPEPKSRNRSVDSSDDSGDGDDPGNRSQRVTTVVVRGNDEAVIAREYYHNEDENDYAIHSYTDRPIYRPGQRINFRDIVRKSVSGASANRYTTPANQEIALELRDPSGEKLLAVSGRTSADGCYWGHADLDTEAPTGVYSLITTLDGEVHTHDIVIASYRKPEFTATVTPDKAHYVRGDTVSMTVNAEYYFGAPVAGAKIEYSVYRDSDYTRDVDYSDDADEGGEFSDSGRDTYFGQEVTSGKAQLDENGKAVVSFRADTPPDPEGPQRDKYVMSVTVIEGEDNQVTAEGMAHVTTGDCDLSVVAEGSLASPGSADSLLITAKSMDGKPLPDQEVEIETGYQHWLDDGPSYTRVSLAKAKLDAEGKLLYAVTPSKAGELQVKVRAWDSRNNKVVARAYIWVSSEDGGDMDTRYNDLSIHTDKRQYNPGDTARVLVNSMRTGQSVLLTIESDQVHHTQIVLMKGRSVVVHVPILAEYGPNVYLGACYVREKKFATSETALRVTMPKQTLNVAIAADRDPAGKVDLLAKYQPGDSITYHVKTTDEAGKPISANLSFGVVDEAIYALKEDVPGALKDDFYPHRFNAVQTEYSFAIAFMGDADKSEPQMVTRKKFPDTAYWNPDIHTDAKGEATITFVLPDSLTTWRATATGVTLDTRIGRATQKVVVSKDFLVRLEAPRFLTQKDKSRLVTAVHNDTGASQSVTVRMELSGCIAVQGALTQEVQLDAGKRGELVWPIDAVDPGDAKITVRAWTRKGADGRQYTDGLESTLPVVPHGRETAGAIAGVLNSNAPSKESVDLDPAAAPGSARLTVRVTPSITGALLGAANYLVGYPYGCTEQTMSRFLPDLLVARVLKQHGMPAPDNAAEIPRMVRNGLVRLARFQHEKSGGWGWWEHDIDDGWMTAYVLYGLSVAKQEGYSVPATMLQRGRQAAVDILAAKTAQNDANTRAFLMYSLALAGNVDVPRQRCGDLRMIDLNSEGLGYLVMLKKLLGESVDLPLSELERRSKFGDSMIHWDDDTAPYLWEWHNLQSTSVAFRAILAVNREDPRCDQILRWMMCRRTGQYWSNTRDTAWALLALCSYMEGRNTGPAEGDIRVSLNGRALATLPLNATTMKEKELIVRAPAADLHTGRNQVTLERTGTGLPVFYSVELKQVVSSEDMKAIAPVMPVTAHLQSEPAHTGAKGGDPANQLIISREYLRLTPRRGSGSSWSLDAEPTNNQLVEGDRIRVKLVIRTPRPMDYVLIEDPFPAGCEVTERGDADEVVDWGYWYSSVDIRDSKIAFFARSVPAGISYIEYNLRAKTHGSYHAMPTLLQGMYSPDMHAESAEDRVMIR